MATVPLFLRTVGFPSVRVGHFCLMLTIIKWQGQESEGSGIAILPDLRNACVRRDGQVMLVITQHSREAPYGH
jgi:hypothetical protein